VTEKKSEEDEFWAEGSFAETMSSDDAKKKMRTFHMKHDEEMNFNCKNAKGKYPLTIMTGITTCVISASMKCIFLKSSHK